MSSVVTATKTNSVTLVSHQTAVHPVTIVGGTQNAATKKGVVITMFHGYVEVAADSLPGSFFVQVSPLAGASSVNEDWITVAEFMAKGTTPDTEAMTATEPVGETVLAVASTTGFAVRDLLYIQDTGTLADSEWAELKTFVTTTNVQLIDGLTVQKDSADVIWNDASKFVCALDLTGIEQYRVLWVHEGATGANAHVKATGVTYDSDLVT